MASCGTLNRAGKDAFLFAISPALIIYGGATDGYTSAQSVRTGIEGGGATEVLAFPFTFLYHAFEHTIYGVAHLIDLPLCLLYGPAELHPNGPEVMPLDLYQGTLFDKWAAKKKGTDAESGEPVTGG